MEAERLTQLRCRAAVPYDAEIEEHQVQEVQEGQGLSAQADCVLKGTVAAGCTAEVLAGRRPCAPLDVAC